jgi:Zn finger protein HypA/HybF involved in hydrogenase expression
MTVLPGHQQYACASCGAALEFAPGTAGLVCPYCQARLDIAAPEAGSPKHDYAAYLGQPHTPVAALPPFDLSCRNCGSQQQMTAIAGRCPSCRGPLVVTEDLGGQLKAPDGVVTFVVDKLEAANRFREWTSSRWFAPSALKKVASTESMRGTYLPHWGFDDRTTTDYTGQRGDHYYTTETYTTQENGQTVTQTRQVQHTSWSHAQGRVSRDFVDILANGVISLDSGLIDKLGPWSTAAAAGYQSEYLAGFDSPRYEVDADTGFSSAKQEMAAVIEQDCRADIGGDEQRVDGMNTYDQDVLFRLLLLPLWIAAYVAGGKTFDVYVNANTGEVVGERPYSAVKIVSAVVAAIMVITTAYLLYKANVR